MSDPDLQITAIPSGHITQVLAQIMPHINRVAPRTNGRSSADDILKELLAGESTLWMVFDPATKDVHGITITKVMRYPRCNMLNCYYTAGNKLRLWQDRMMNVLMSWARDNNCVKIEFVGRAGWLKTLKPWGVTEAYRLFEIEVKYE